MSPQGARTATALSVMLSASGRSAEGKRVKKKSRSVRVGCEDMRGPQVGTEGGAERDVRGRACATVTAQI